MKYLQKSESCSNIFSKIGREIILNLNNIFFFLLKTRLLTHYIEAKVLIIRW